MMPSEPNVARVILRVELADGQVREFEAREPYGLECEVKRPGMFGDLTPSLPPTYITAGEATSVKIEFKANFHRHSPITIRTEQAEEERCARCGAPSAYWRPLHRQEI
jgi:hypothetical protein